MSYLPGEQLRIDIPVQDSDSDVFIDPGDLTIRVVPPTAVGVAAVYGWDDGTPGVWTLPSPVPIFDVVTSRISAGQFRIVLTIPRTNAAVGRWAIGWEHSANGGGLGEGSGEATFMVRQKYSLPA